jgi:hypothetical protein
MKIFKNSDGDVFEESVMGKIFGAGVLNISCDKPL